MSRINVNQGYSQTTQLSTAQKILASKLFRMQGAELSQFLKQEFNQSLVADLDAIESDTSVSLDDINPDYGLDPLDGDLYTRANESFGADMRADGAVVGIPDDKRKEYATVTTRTDDLQGQLDTLKLDERSKLIGSFLIASLNDDGLLLSEREINKRGKLHHELLENRANEKGLEGEERDLFFKKNEFLRPSSKEEVFGSLLAAPEQFKLTEIELTLLYLQEELRPIGLFASSAQDSLRVQLEIAEKKGIGNPYDREYARLIISDDYQLFLERKNEVIAKKYNLDIEDLQEVYAFINNFSPTPYKVFEQSHYRSDRIEPSFYIDRVGYDSRELIKTLDAIHEKVETKEQESIVVLAKELARSPEKVELFRGGELNELPSGASKAMIDRAVDLLNKASESYSVRMTGDTPSLRISTEGNQLLEFAQKAANRTGARDTDKNFFVALKEDAAKIKSFQSILEYKRVTSERILTYLVNAQEEFIKSADENKLRPLLMKDVADAIGVSVSYVSTLVSGKIVQGPPPNYERFEARALMSLGIQANDGIRYSKGELQQKLLDYVRNERHEKPLSDLALENMFKKEKITITNHQVARLRKSLNIPSDAERRRFYDKEEGRKSATAVIRDQGIRR